MNELHLKLWAKSEPHHFLWRHLLDAAAVCQALLPRFGGVPPLPDAWVCLLVGLHDIGKADGWFQNKDDDLARQLGDMGLALPKRDSNEPPEKLKFRHEARSAEWMLDWLVQRGWGKPAARVAAAALRGHHGDFGAADYPEKSEKASWDAHRAALLQLVWDVLQPPALSLTEFFDASAAGIKLSGLIVLSDWIASNHELYGYQNLATITDPAAYWAATQQRAAEVVQEMELDAPPLATATGPLTFAHVWPALAETPRPAQHALDMACQSGVAPGLAIIEAPMGEGKTEAAIYLAREWNRQSGRSGVYIALPTQATSNQMHGRYEKFLGARPRLVHGMAWLIDDKSPAQAPQTWGENAERLLAREWFRPARRALLAPEGVGTVDQALLAALHVKFGFLRLLGLGCKTLIIDEVHAYDEYMTTLMERLLKWCRALGISVILLSATLSSRQKSRLLDAYQGRAIALPDKPAEEPYPLLTFAPLGGEAFTVPIARDPKHERMVCLKTHPGLLRDAGKTARLAVDLVHEGGCLCVLANTVGSAQEIFEALRGLQVTGQMAADTQLFLFHARFRAEARNAIETKITALFGKDAGQEGKPERPQRAIVVATQVVEQSLDVDFDHMISQIAPVDLLLQRSGRLHRHPPKTRPTDAVPVLHILMPETGTLDFGPTGKVYDACEPLLRTLSLLHAGAPWRLPDDFRPLIEACYGRGPLPNDVVPVAELEKAAQIFDRKRAGDANVARTHLLPEPSPRVFELARRSVEESDDGPSNDFFRASTRLGDDARAALVLHDSTLIALAQSATVEQKPPWKKVLRQLFAQKVNLPAWWVKGATPAAGYEPLFEGENWLRRHLIVPLRNGEWHGHDAKGRPFIIRDDEILGVQRIAVTDPHRQLKGESDGEEEADAGRTA